MAPLQKRLRKRLLHQDFAAGQCYAAAAPKSELPESTTSAEESATSVPAPMSYYELLSYNPMGNDKRKRLGYPVPEITALPAARMRELARTAASAGIPVWLNGTQYHNIED